MKLRLTIGTKLLLATLALAALVTVAVQQSRRGDTASHAVRQQLRTMLKSRLPATIVAGDDSAAILIKRFYKERRYSPAWVGAEPLGRAKELTEVLKSAAEEGMDPDDYGTELIENRLDKANLNPLELRPDPAMLADLELRLTAAFLRYGSDLFDGRVDPKRLPTEWRTRPRRTSMLEKLETAVNGDVRETLQSLAPPHPEYQKLREALKRYREIADHGGWPPVPPGPVLALNRAGARVEALRQRLAATGDLASSAARGQRFDVTLERAVQNFQKRQGLEVTGRVGAADLAALNLPVEARIRQIEINMERWRWLPEKLGDPAIVVNIPDFMLDVYENGRPKLEMRVVVGKAVDRTPVFSDEISYVVFGPSWHIPRSIVTEELLPAQEGDRNYLASKGIRVFDGAGPDAREVDAHSVGGGWFGGSDGTEYAYRQDPGADNPLGRVKFMCPNQFDVYLHDTPADHLFQQRLRTFSHGCIRVEKPDELANYLLRGKDDWNQERIAAAMDSAHDESVTLPQPVPVHILYWTAWVDEAGTLQFRSDTYGLDATVAGALRRHDQAVEDRLSMLKQDR